MKKQQALVSYEIEMYLLGKSPDSVALKQAARRCSGVNATEQEKLLMSSKERMVSTGF